jgi:DNA-binding CsgD family transcriptional regulator
MTARLLSVSPTTLQPVNSWLSQRSRKSTRRTSAQGRSESPIGSKSEPLGSPQRDHTDQDALLAVLLEAIQEGVMVVASTTLQLIYINHQAKELCDQLQNSESDSALPAAIVETCHRFLRSPSASPEPLITEFQEHPEQFIRVRVRWLQFGGLGETVDPSYLLIQLEDCYQALKEELALEKQKYDLTDREAEVWIMMRQKYSYQEISEILSISLNTVKTHVKNVNSKRKNLMDDRRVWYSR